MLFLQLLLKRKKNTTKKYRDIFVSTMGYILIYFIWQGSYDEMQLWFPVIFHLILLFHGKIMIVLFINCQMDKVSLQALWDGKIICTNNNNSNEGHVKEAV